MNHSPWFVTVPCDSYLFGGYGNHDRRLAPQGSWHSRAEQNRRGTQDERNPHREPRKRRKQDKENRHHRCHQRRFLTSTRQSRVSPNQTPAPSQRGAALSPRIHGSKNCHQIPGTLSPERQSPNRPCHHRDCYSTPHADSPVTIIW